MVCEIVLLLTFVLACENIRFSSLFADGDVSRGGTKRPRRRRARRNGCFRRLVVFRQ